MPLTTSPAEHSPAEHPGTPRSATGAGTRARACLLLLTGLLLTACGGGSEIDDEDFRGLVLAGINADVIVPNLQEMAQTASGLESAVAAFEASPSVDTLEAARSAWRGARRSWNRAEAIIIGPAKDRFLAAQVDTSPIDEARIEALAGASQALDADVIAGLGATQKGFHVLEYLLFDDPGVPGSALSRLSQGAGAPRRRLLARVVAEDLARVVNEIWALWDPARGGYANQWVNAGTSASTLPTRQAAIDLLLNHLIEVAEQISDKRLGRPLGKTSGGLPQPAGAESSRSGNSLDDVIHDLLGVRDIYMGKRDGSLGNGVSTLFRGAFIPTHRAIKGDIDLALAETLEIPPTLLDSAIAQREVVEEAFEAARQLKTRFVVDLSAVLGGTLTFPPFDGD